MNLKEQAVSGVKWTTLNSLTLALCSLLKISILARFLEKEDFGLMALIMFVMGFLNLFMDMGLSSAILYKQDIKKKEYSSLYWINIVFSMFLFITIYLISPFIGSFYNNPELVGLVRLMGISLILSSLGKQFKTILEKEFRFKSIALIEIVSAVLSLIIAVILAWHNYGIYALILSSLFQYFLINMLFLIIGLRNYGLLLHFVFLETKPFLKIGLFEVGGQIINYFNRDLDILIIGKFFGSELLGGYSLAKQLVYRPAQVLNPIFTKVASPILAKMQNDVKVLKTSYLKLLNIVSTINVPIYACLLIFAPIAVAILYGEDYENIIYLVRVLSVYMIFRAFGNPVGSLLIATGRTDIGFYWNLANFLIMPLIIFIGVQFSLETVTILITLSMIVLFIPSWYFLVYKLTNTSLQEYVKSLIPNFRIKEIRGYFK
ncbi:colanic acid exporter [Aquimarina sp. BL5]|uniref:MOP flippase family protein n=1 Tax=Aquimarina sp. BL5 TaxID=1714860 RepID=UPI000E4D9461|nr:MOP flippase family protein [Aquimarina sp. BL5]AXT51968.1 colanic acid exporter [Aquimarina sp. BL5]RKM89830.1 colanic acid exporter [Aquimarina sp. BL5]